MARTTGSDGARTEAAIRESATKMIARFGYEAVTMRRLADEVGVQAAALYRYFPTKHMEALIEAWRDARPSTADPVARLSAFVENHLRFHVARRHSTHLSNMELRSLSPEKMTSILRLRGSYEKELRKILRDGAQTGDFLVDETGLTSMAIIQMITGVIVWFRPDDRLSVKQVTHAYLAMTLRLAGARTGPDPREHANVHEHA
jgi:AcrR family transcriptional regulator